MEKGIQYLSQVDVLIKGLAPCRLFSHIRDISAFKERILFDGEVVKFLNVNWTMEIFEKERVMILHRDIFQVYLDFDTRRGRLSVVQSDEDSEDDLLLKTEELTSEDSDDRENDELGPCPTLIAAIFIDEDLMYSEKRLIATYQPKEQLKSAQLKVLSTIKGLIYSDDIKYKNYQSLYQYFTQNPYFDGLFLERKDKSQYNYPGSYKSCVRIRVIVTNNEIDKIPKKFP